MSTQDSLADFLAYKHLNYRDFEKKVGMGQSTASRLSERSTPRTFKRISDAFPDLNAEWLRTGEGDMLLPVTQTANGNGNVQVAGNGNTLSSSAVDELKAQLAKKDEQIERLLAIIDKLTNE